MATASLTSQAAFYQEFLMSRRSFQPQEFGVDMELENFIDLMCDDFGAYTRGQLSLDEMLLRPRTALHFCDIVRNKHSYYDLPDDIILRSVMRRRKSGETG